MNTPVLCDFKPLEIVKEQSKRPCLIYQDIKFEKPTQVSLIHSSRNGIQVWMEIDSNYEIITAI